MAFDVRLYKCTDDYRKINKTLNNEIVCRGLWQNQSEITAPTFKIAMNENVLTDYNYAYIPKFKRYYFIVNRYPEDGVNLVITLKEDERMTFKTEILNSTQCISRQESPEFYNKYLIDSKLPLISGFKMAITKFPNTPFNTDGANFIGANRDEYKPFILITSGAKTT